MSDELESAAAELGQALIKIIRQLIESMTREAASGGKIVPTGKATGLAPPDMGAVRSHVMRGPEPAPDKAPPAPVKADPIKGADAAPAKGVEPAPAPKPRPPLEPPPTGKMTPFGPEIPPSLVPPMNIIMPGDDPLPPGVMARQHTPQEPFGAPPADARDNAEAQHRPPLQPPSEQIRSTDLPVPERVQVKPRPASQEDMFFQVDVNPSPSVKPVRVSQPSPLEPPDVQMEYRVGDRSSIQPQKPKAPEQVENPPSPPIDINEPLDVPNIHYVNGPHNPLPRQDPPPPTPLPVPSGNWDAHRGWMASDPFGQHRLHANIQAEIDSYDQTTDMLYSSQLRQGKIDRDYRDRDYDLKLRHLKDANNQYRRIDDLERRHDLSMENITDVNL